MIEFKYVKFKNILSTGNNFTTINLNANKSTLIIGENGAGKSTMLDAISLLVCMVKRLDESVSHSC